MTPITVHLDLAEGSYLVRLRTSPDGPEWQLSSSDARVLGAMLIELGEQSCCASGPGPRQLPRIILGHRSWFIDETLGELRCEGEPWRRLRYDDDAN